MKYVSSMLGLFFVSIVFATVVPQKKDKELLPELTILFNNDDQVVLPPDLAFGFEHEFYAELLLLSWNIQPGYFIYRNKVAVLCDQNEVKLNLPIGKPWQDEVFGDVSILEGEIEVQIDATRERSDCSISYQGCSLMGYCYPPQKMAL